MRDFEDLSNQYDAYLEEYGLCPSQQKPGKSGRAQQLSDALQPLCEIKPNLENQYLVKGWITRGSSSVLYGGSNVGKTFFALDMATHVAGNMSWHDVNVAKPYVECGGTKVIYLALEGGLGIANRLEAMRLQMPKLINRIERNNSFHLLTVPIDLHDLADGKALAEGIRSVFSKVDLIVIDTLARAMGSGDENTARDMGAFIKSVDTLRAETSAHVMIIHHSGKDASKGARGSGSLRGAVDTEIELTRSGEVIMAEQRKQRDIRSDNTFAFTLKPVVLGMDEDGEEIASAIVEQAEPVAKRPRLSGQQLIAMQAFEDAVAHHGEKRKADIFPQNRMCISLEIWREFCDRHSLSNGTDPSSARQAFGRAWKSLQEKSIVRVIDGYAWRCDKT